MSLSEDPLYKKLTEGFDTKLLVGTLGVPVEDRIENFALFLIDYYGAPSDLESTVEDAFDDVKKINLVVKPDGNYFISVEDQGTLTVFSGGETAVHTAPTFWGEYTPEKEEHEAFQREFTQKGVWILMVITKTKVRKILVDRDGKVVFRKTVPLTDELKKMLGVE